MGIAAYIIPRVTSIPGGVAAGQQPPRRIVTALRIDEIGDLVCACVSDDTGRGRLSGNGGWRVMTTVSDQGGGLVVRVGQ